ncbi:MAG: hypothetical protein ACREEM_06685 [Blastocatellia bacterium]
MISKFPVHNLAKTGRVNIKLNRKRADGEVEFQWEVSYNEKYGEAKQLAYQIDTLIIAKRIYEYFEVNLPIPEVIPIGSLYQICQELGMNPQSGKNKNNLKRALGQNAGAFIDAKIFFKDRNGEERNLTAQFSRYAVIHRDQKLPDGRRADQIYIVLQPIYLEVLNSARWRPLDFGYLKELPPASQRCYEIISTRIFAALKYGHSHADMVYSDYCAFSAHMRHSKYKPFRAQMDHVHKPHLASGYLDKVEFEETRDADGQIDWLIKYYPGQKARAEYAHFNSPKGPRNGQRLGESVVTGSANASDSRAGQGSEVRKLVEYFHQLAHRDAEPGRKELDQAAKLINQYGVDAARYIVEFAHKEAPKTKFEMQVFGAVLVYEKRALMLYRKWKAKAENRKNEIQEEMEKLLRQEEEEKLLRKAEERINSLPREVFEALYAKAKKETIKKSPAAANWDEETMHGPAMAIIRRQMIDEILQENDKARYGEALVDEG